MQISYCSCERLGDVHVQLTTEMRKKSDVSLQSKFHHQLWGGGKCLILSVIDYDSLNEILCFFCF